MMRELFFDALTSRVSESGWRLDIFGTEDDHNTYIRDEGDVIFQLGVSVSSDHYANPSIGVQHPEVSRLLASFHRLPLRPGRTVAACSVGATLANLLRLTSPGVEVWNRWHIGDLYDAAPVASLLYEDLESVGIPFLNSAASLTLIVDHLAGNDKRYQVLNAHLAIAAALLGRTDIAMGALADYVEQARPQTGRVAEQSRTFIEEYVRHFGVGHAVAGLPDY